jgi:hypothetical protein
VLLNLLSVAAAYGVIVALFQWGWGQSLLGFTSVHSVASCSGRATGTCPAGSDGCRAVAPSPSADWAACPAVGRAASGHQGRCVMDTIQFAVAAAVHAPSVQATEHALRLDGGRAAEQADWVVPPDSAPRRDPARRIPRRARAYQIRVQLTARAHPQMIIRLGVTSQAGPASIRRPSGMSCSERTEDTRQVTNDSSLPRRPRR